MAETWTRLLSSIVDSSISREDHATFRVWIILLAKSDIDGYVWASLGGIADAARVTDDECRRALEKFMRPDPDSRSDDYDGRRIEKVDRGWLLLNKTRFRDMRDEDEKRRRERERKRAQRAREKAGRASTIREPATDFDGSPSETICPGDILARFEKIIPEMVSHLAGSTAEQIRASANRCATYYTIGKGMGAKRSFWMRVVREWVSRDHGVGKLTGKRSEKKGIATILAERVERMEAEEKRRAAE